MRLSFHRVIFRRLALALCLLATTLPHVSAVPAPQAGTTAARIAEFDAFLLSGEYGRAIDAYEEALAGQPGDEALRLRHAAALLKRDEAAAALAAAEQAAATHPSADTFALKSLALFRNGRFRDAETERDRAVALAQAPGSKASGLPFLAHARLLASVGATDKAFESISLALKNDTFLDRVFRVDMLMTQASLLDDLDLDTKSIQALETALAIAPRTNSLFIDNLTARLEFQRSIAGKDLLSLGDGPRSAIIKTTFLQGLPLVSVSVDGAEPELFILDTGAGITILFEDYARRTGFKPRQERAWAGAVGGDGKLELRYGLAGSVALGGMTVRNVPVGVIDWKLGRVAGIIGLPLFKPFVTTFDYQRKEIRLRRSQDESNAMATPARAGIPFRSAGGAIFVEATVNGKGPFNFEIDTGAGPSAVPVDESVAKAVGLTPLGPSARKASGAGASGEQQATLYENAQVAWGNIPAVKVNLLSQRITPARPERRKGESGLIAETEVHGLIGYALLKDSSLTLDFTTRRLWVGRSGQ